MVQHQTHLVQGRIDTVRKEEEEQEEARQPFCTACNKRHVAAGLMGVCGDGAKFWLSPVR
jgi:hypothetical protein